MIDSEAQVRMTNDLTLAALRPGPCAFHHRHLWDRIHAVVDSHGKRDVYDSYVAMVPEMMLQEVHADMVAQGFLEAT